MPRFLTVATAVVVGFTSTGCFSAHAAKPSMEQMSDFTSCVSTEITNDDSLSLVVTDDIRETCRGRASIDRGVDMYDALTHCSAHKPTYGLSSEAITADATAIQCEFSLDMFEHSKHH